MQMEQQKKMPHMIMEIRKTTTVHDNVDMNVQITE